jgi:hypothetical protein
MALNLWTTNGKPSSYIPFPNVTQSYPNLDIGQYVFSFYAYSPSNAIFRIGGQNNNLTANGAHPYNITLSQTRTLYTVNVINTSVQSFQILDANNIGDIVIDSISLTKAPLAKNTINAVDGFLSGKWVNGGGGNGTCNYIINSDNSLTIQSRDGTWKGLTLDIPVIPNTKYVFSGSFLSSVNNGLNFRVDSLDNNKSFSSTLVNGGYSQSAIQQGVSFTSSNSYIRIFLQTPSIEDLTFSNLILNLGSIPAPYEPKRGDKMVLPTSKNKNLFDGSLEYGRYLTSGSGAKDNVPTTGIRSVNKFPIQPNTTYCLSSYDLVFSGTNDVWVVFYDSTGNNALGFAQAHNISFTTPSNCYFITFYVPNVSQVAVSLTYHFQLEQGTTATSFSPYTPYAVQLNPKPKRAIASANKGLAFNGVTDYVRISATTSNYNFSIEAVIKLSQYSSDLNTGSCILSNYNTGNGYIFSVLNSGKLSVRNHQNGTSKQLDSHTVIPLNTIVKVKITLNNGIASLYINDVLDISDSGHNYTPLNTHAMGVASWSFSSSYFNGVILSASYYDGALQLFNYDFTNPNTITGTTVLTNGNTNLLPSFDSGQWTIHANAKVLGKDVLHLDATGTFQTSSVLLDVIPNKNYVYYCNTNGTVRIYNGTTTSDSLLTASTGVSFTPTVGKILINIHNGSASTGSFDFIRPQLYQLNGTEGTINGSPVLLKKSSARKLFAKR